VIFTASGSTRALFGNTLLGRMRQRKHSVSVPALSGVKAIRRRFLKVVFIFLVVHFPSSLFIQLSGAAPSNGCSWSATTRSFQSRLVSQRRHSVVVPSVAKAITIS
jgi:hypothetical protein